MLKQGTLIHNGNFKFDNLPDRPEKPTSQEIADIITPKPQGVVADTAWLIYDEDERQIGMWYQMVDGVKKKKPLYQKTIITTLPNVETDKTEVTKEVDVGLSDWGNVFIDSSCILSSGENGNSLSVPYSTPDGYHISTFMRASNHTFVITSNRLSFNGRRIDSIVKYTKSTDTWQTVE